MALDLNKLHNQLDTYMKVLLSRDEYKDAQVSAIYKNGIFKSKAKSITSLTVLHYLLKILVPNKLSKVLWPLYDNRMEAEFKRISLEILGEIFKNKSNMQKINMSIFVTGFGVKLVHTLLNLACEILQRDLRGKENTALRLRQLEKKCLSVKPGEDRCVKAMINAVENVERLKQAEQLVMIQRAQTRAPQLISGIIHSEDFANKVAGEAANFMQNKSLDVAIFNDESKFQDFQNQAEMQCSVLNDMMTKVTTLLGKAAPCKFMSTTQVQQINGGNTTIDLIAVVKKAHEFRNSNLLVNIFGTAGKENQNCTTLIQKVIKLVLDTDDHIIKEITKSEVERSKKQAKYDAITKELRNRISWTPSIPEPYLAISDPDWLNTWDSYIRGEAPNTSPVESQDDGLDELRISFDTLVKKEVEKFAENKTKLSLVDILFLDNENKKFSPPCKQGNATACNQTQQNTIASPTSSGSPLACSSRIMTSFASTPVRKQADSPVNETPPVRKHEESLLYNLLCNKMSDKPLSGSPGTKRSSLSDLQGFNHSFGSGVFNVPSNLSDTTCSPSSFLHSFVDDSPPHHSPVPAPSPTIEKPRPSFQVIIDKFKKIKEKQQQEVDPIE